MNRYKLGFGLFLGILLFVFFWYERAPAPSLPSLSRPPITASPTTETPASTSWTHLFGNNAGETSKPAVLPSISAAPPPADVSALLLQMTATLEELQRLQQQLDSLWQTQDQAPDEATQNLYQPQMEQLTQAFDRLVKQALQRDSLKTQQFLWDQALLYTFDNNNAGWIALNSIPYPPNPALFEAMLATLASTQLSVDTRYALSYNLLQLSNPNAPYEEKPAGKPASKAATPHQQRIRQFLEEQFQQETEPFLLDAYLNVYASFADAPYNQITPEQFLQQLEMARPNLAPGNYFRIRLQRLMATETPDVFGEAALWREMTHAFMNTEQRAIVTGTLNELIVSTQTGKTAEEGYKPLSEERRQLWLSYMQQHTPRVAWEQLYTLYDYGQHVYATELLRNREQVATTLYQRILNSQRSEEQVSLILAAPLAGEALLNKLRETPLLKQRLTQLLQQPTLPEDARYLVENALSNLQPDAPPEPELPFDANGNPLPAAE